MSIEKTMEKYLVEEINSGEKYPLKNSKINSGIRSGQYVYSVYSKNNELLMIIYDYDTAKFIQSQFKIKGNVNI